MKNRVPEILLPVGSREMCQAAIHNGADAVYMGVPEFNARGRSQDFALEELREMMEECHLYGVKVHLALNVLIFEGELPRVEKLLRELLLLGPDAFIIQDLGLLTLIRKMSPDVPIHASTQMTVTNHESMECLKDLGIQRFVLGREISLPELEMIRKESSAELEVFVHGALCVAYSGQCFTSEGIGGRSANRGQCAQSCRPEYDLIVDGVKKDLGEKRHLVSPQDLCGLDDVPALAGIGIDSFKVEGRLKTPEYVAQTAQAYGLARLKTLSHKEREKLKHRMGVTYSRGFYSGWLHGVQHQKLVEGTYSSHRGVFLGWVRGTVAGKILLESSQELRAGQGLLFVLAAGEKEKREWGGKIATSLPVKKTPHHYQVTLWENLRRVGAQKVIPPGTKVYLNSDPQLEKELRQSFENREQKKRIPVKIKVTGSLGTPLHLEISDGIHRVEVSSREILVRAESNPLSSDSLREILGQMGGTCFTLELVHWEGNGKNLFLQQREIKEMRKGATHELALLRIKPPSYPVSVVSLPPTPIPSSLISPISSMSPSLLHLLLRKGEQVEALVKLVEQFPEIRQNLGTVILDFEFGRDYASSVETLREEGLPSGIATTRIQRPKEFHHLKIIERMGVETVLVRNLGALQYLTGKGLRLVGDFSLNATNHLTYDYLLGKGLSTLCASYDLSASQLRDLVKASPRDKIEVTLHQYMPLFHMEHCVFAAFLSSGSSFRDCGKPCEKHQVELRDLYGNTHFLKADQECRNTMFSGKAQSAASLITELQHLGVRHFRLELLDETAEILEQKILVYLQLLSGKIPSSQVLHSLGVMERYGVGAGTLAMEHSYKDRKKH